MENKIDNLFRDKLSGHEVGPSQKAWDQIHNELKSKRRAIWVKRLAIAASFALLATLGLWSYKSAGTYDAASNEEKISLNYDKNTKGTEQDRLESESSTEVFDQQNEVVTRPDAVEESSSIVTKRNEQVNPEEESKEVLVHENLTQNDEAFQKDEILTAAGQDNLDKMAIAGAALTSPGNHEHAQEQVATKAEPEGTENLFASADSQAKAYPSIRIVYKASGDSELVESERSSIIDRGINKITDFSEEHLLTADRKTKLRNTKEDLLALNFGKLLNKSNKDLEN